MIFHELVLHNFGLYAGRQALDLVPDGENRPIILIGGLNGGGKTTLLDAVHLVLYGKRARCSNRRGLPYDEYLKRSIHRNASPQEASLELAFEHWEAGKPVDYRVRRMWRSPGRTVVETLEVERNGVLDGVLTETWDQQVEEFIPHGVSGLFLFDGEQIEELADVENSSKLLETALQSLLGLGLVDQLESDLRVLERRKRQQLGDTQVSPELERLESAATQLRQQRADLVAQSATLSNDIDRRTQMLRALDQDLASQGSDLFSGRSELERERKRVEEAKRQAAAHLQDLAAGPLPLALAGDLLTAVANQDGVEQKSERSAALLTELSTRDEALLKHLERTSAPGALEAAAKFLRSDLEQRREVVMGADRYLHLSVEGRSAVAALVQGQLHDAVESTATRASEAEEYLRQADELDRRLNAVPEEDSLAPLVGQRQTVESELAVLKGKAQYLEEERQRIVAELERTEHRLARLYESDVRTKQAQEDDQRMVRFSQRSRGTLARFRQAVLSQHIERIESLVLDSFSQLLRKRRLVKALRIDPESLRVTLQDADGASLSPSRLSAGERQLLALSFLWGLARASSRPLPTIIDTPLGRLDSAHRRHLVERYFPNASHQVLLLSTDEEIDGELLRRLKPRIARSYVLAQDGDGASTTIQQGYFW